MNNKTLSKKTKKELIELFKEIKEQNNSLKVSIIINQSFINTLTATIESKNKFINEQKELINAQKNLITLIDKDIEKLNKKINKLVKYSIMFQIAIIVSALLMIFFI